MTKDELKQVVQEMIAAPSCCQELKAAGQKWLNVIGTADEKTAASELLQEVRGDVCTVAHTIEFFESPLAAQIFGVDQAKAMAAHAHEIQNNGAKWCDCPACAAGLKVIENAALLS